MKVINDIVPVKHDIKDYLYSASILFKNGNGLLVMVDAKNQLDAENKVKIFINEQDSFHLVESKFIVPVVHIVS